jgi:hypothetical protein
MQSASEGHVGLSLDDRKKQLYGNLFFLLQTEPRHIAHLARLVSLSEIDTLLQTVMFTLYGNQYESREEHLLLTMFQVTSCAGMPMGAMNVVAYFFFAFGAHSRYWLSNLILLRSLDPF